MPKLSQSEKLKNYYRELIDLPDFERIDAIKDATDAQVKEVFCSDAPPELIRLFEDKYVHLYPPTFEQCFSAAIAGVRFAFEDAMKILEKMIGKEKVIEVCKYQADQGNMDALKIMMLYYADEEDEESMIKVYIKSAELGNGVAARELAEQYSTDGCISEAEKYYLIAIKNGEWTAHEDYGLFLERLGRTDEAIEQYKAVLRYDMSRKDQLIALLELEGRHEEAELYKQMHCLN